jgi:hypothetical protein
MSDIEDKRHAECKACGAPFIRYNTIQALCRDCSIIRAKKLAPTKAQLRREVRLIEMQGNARTGNLLKTISMKPRKPIAKKGKVAKRDEVFLMKVLRPYLDTKFGLSCSKCGVMPGIKEDGTYYRHDADHVKGKGPHPELRFDVRNFVYLCRTCHIEKTGVPQWTKKAST